MLHPIIRSHIIENIAIYFLDLNSWWEDTMIRLGLCCFVRRCLFLCYCGPLAALGNSLTKLQWSYPLSSMETCPVPWLSHENSNKFIPYDDFERFIQSSAFLLCLHLHMKSRLTLGLQIGAPKVIEDIVIRRSKTKRNKPRFWFLARQQNLKGLMTTEAKSTWLKVRTRGCSHRTRLLPIKEYWVVRWCCLNSPLQAQCFRSGLQFPADSGRATLGKSCSRNYQTFRRMAVRGMPEKKDKEYVWNNVELGMVTHTCKSWTWDVGSGEKQEFKVNLSCILSLWLTWAT